MLENEAERIESLEKTVKQQGDEIICLRSSLSDVLRRLDKLENSQTPTSHLLVAKKVPPKVTLPSKTPTPSASNPTRTNSISSPSPLLQPQLRSTSSMSLSIEPKHHPKPKRTSTAPGTTEKETDGTVSFNKITGLIRFYLRGRPLIFHLTNNYLDTTLGNEYLFDLKKKLEAPKASLDLNWVYGYRGKDCRNNLYQLETGEMIYFIAATVVLHNLDERTQRHYREHTDDIKSLAIHPDRVTIATGQVTGHHKSEGKAHIRIWNAVNLNTIKIIGLSENFVFSNAVACLAFSKTDGGHQLCAIDDGNEKVISVWNWQNGTKVSSTKCFNDLVFSVEYHPSEKNMLISCGKQHMFFWSMDSGSHLLKKSAIFDKTIDKPKYIICVSVLANGEVVSGDSEGHLLVWNLKEYKISKVIKEAHDGGVFSVLPLAKDSAAYFLSGGGKDGKIVEWNSSFEKTGRVMQIGEASGACRFIAQAKDDFYVVGTTKNCILKGNFDLGLNTVVYSHSDELWGLATHPTDASFITCGNDRNLFYWDVLSHAPLWEMHLENAPDSESDFGAAHCVDIHPTFNLAAIGFAKPNWCVYDLTQRKIVSSMTDGSEQIQCVQYAPNGEYLACGSRDNFIYVYTVSEDGCKYARIGRCQGHSSFITHIDWSLDSQYLMSNSGDYEVHVWQIPTCKLFTNTQEIREIQWKTNNCIFSLNTIGIWNSVDREADSSVNGNGGGSKGVKATSHDGTDINACCVNGARNLLVSVDDFGMVNLFNYPACASKAEKRVYNGHSSHVTNAKFIANDSRLLTTGGNDMAIFEWTVNMN